MGLLIIFSFNGSYTLASFRCGHKPIIALKGFGSSSYYTPDDPLYETYAHTAGTHYYCTELDAKAAGLYKLEAIR